MIQTIADTIIWLAKERMKTESFQNLASAIYAVSVEVDLLLIDAMINAVKEMKK